MESLIICFRESDMSTVIEIKMGRIANTSIATKIGIKVWGNALKMFSMSVIIISVQENYKYLFL
jgi:hypothetical protein